MAEPLSISTGVLSLLRVAWTVSTELKKFHDDVSVVNQTITDLEQDVAGLTRVLEAMRETFESITAEHGSGTGHIASHWSNLARSIEDGASMLNRLSAQMSEINKHTGFLDGPRKQFRLNMAQDKLSSFRIHIQSYRDGLQLSLQTVILWNQVSYQPAIEQVLPNLSDLHQDVRRIAIELNERIDLLQTRVRTSEDEAEVIAMDNLRECVRSAASIVSSASSIVESQHGEAPAVPQSDFGDCFPAQQNLALRRWLASRTVYEYSETRSRAPPVSVADVRGFGSGEDSSDSDSELEIEITSVLLENGKRKLASGDSRAGERMLKNCLTRLSRKQSSRKSSPAYSTMELDVITQLYELYRSQNNLESAQKLLQQRLNIRERAFGKNDIEYLQDSVTLAKILQARGGLLEAHRYARRALKGFKKVEKSADVRECLLLLVELSGENEDDREAYTVMLMRNDREAPNSSQAQTDTPSLDAPLPGGNAQGHSMEPSTARDSHVAISRSSAKHDYIGLGLESTSSDAGEGEKAPTPAFKSSLIPSQPDVNAAGSPKVVITNEDSIDVRAMGNEQDSGNIMMSEKPADGLNATEPFTGDVVFSPQASTQAANKQDSSSTQVILENDPRRFSFIDEGSVTTTTSSSGRAESELLSPAPAGSSATSYSTSPDLPFTEKRKSDSRRYGFNLGGGSDEVDQEAEDHQSVAPLPGVLDAKMNSERELPYIERHDTSVDAVSRTVQTGSASVTAGIASNTIYPHGLDDKETESEETSLTGPGTKEHVPDIVGTFDDPAETPSRASFDTMERTISSTPQASSENVETSACGIGEDQGHNNYDFHGLAAVNHDEIRPSGGIVLEAVMDGAKPVSIERPERISSNSEQRRDATHAGDDTCDEIASSTKVSAPESSGEMQASIDTVPSTYADLLTEDGRIQMNPEEVPAPQTDVRIIEEDFERQSDATVRESEVSADQIDAVPDSADETGSTTSCQSTQTQILADDNEILTRTDPGYDPAPDVVDKGTETDTHDSLLRTPGPPTGSQWPPYIRIVEATERNAAESSSRAAETTPVATLPFSSANGSSQPTEMSATLFSENLPWYTKGDKSSTLPAKVISQQPQISATYFLQGLPWYEENDLIWNIPPGCRAPKEVDWSETGAAADTVAQKKTILGTKELETFSQNAPDSDNAWGAHVRHYFGRTAKMHEADKIGAPEGLQDLHELPVIQTGAQIAPDSPPESDSARTVRRIPNSRSAVNEQFHEKLGLSIERPQEPRLSVDALRRDSEAASTLDNFGPVSPSATRGVPDVTRKIMLIGSAWVGKTSLLQRLHTGETPAVSFIPTVFENSVTFILVDGKTVELALWDCGGAEESRDQVRLLSYRVAHCVLVCFSIGDQDSLENTEEKWFPETLKYAKGVPTILVGCQKDARENGEVVGQQVWPSNMRPVTREQAEEVRKTHGAIEYLECSAKTGEGVKEVFECAARTALPFDYRRGHLVKDGQPGHQRKRSMLSLFGLS